MAENKILPWAQTGTANVLSDADYASDVASGGLYGDGVKTGQASSKQANKTWRQATAPGSGLSQFLVDNLGVDVTDADTPNTFSTRIANAVLKLAQISPFNKAWATATGGYRKYAIVSDSSGNFWVSTADQNKTVPGANGANWRSLFAGYLTQDQSDRRYVKTGSPDEDSPNEIYLRWVDQNIGVTVDESDIGNLVRASNIATGSVKGYFNGSPNTQSVQLTHTPLVPGTYIVWATVNCSLQPDKAGLSLYFNAGSTPILGDATDNAMTLCGVQPAAAAGNQFGLAYSPQSTTGTWMSISLSINFLFIPS